MRVCFARLSQIKLQQLFTGKESIVSKSLPAVVVLYFTASEKDNLRTESYSYKEQTVTFTVHWKAKLCPSNEK